MSQILYVLSFVTITFLTGCGNKPSVESLSTNEWGCTSTFVEHEFSSEIIIDCPPWDESMVMLTGSRMHDGLLVEAP